MEFKAYFLSVKSFTFYRRYHEEIAVYPAFSTTWSAFAFVFHFRKENARCGELADSTNWLCRICQIL